MILNDSDHSYYGMWNDSAQANRDYIWENFTHGAGVLFMDPYEVYWSNGNRNLCPNPVNGVCSGVDARWNNVRDNLGYTLAYARTMRLAAMTPQGNRASTGYALVNRGGGGRVPGVCAHGRDVHGGPVEYEQDLDHRVVQPGQRRAHRGGHRHGGRVRPVLYAPLLR